MKRLPMNSWTAAFVSWAAATVLVTVVYGVWKYSQGAPINWGVLKTAAFVAGLIALFRAFRDRGRP